MRFPIERSESSRPAPAHELGKVIPLYLVRHGGMEWRCGTMAQAEDKVDAINRCAPLIPSAVDGVEITDRQYMVILCRLMGSKSADVPTYGTGTASGFSGRKIAVSYDGMRSWSVYDADGYSLLPNKSTIRVSE